MARAVAVLLRPVPDQESAEIHEVAMTATYGWGVIAVRARAGQVAFATPLFPQGRGLPAPQVKDGAQAAGPLDR